jgi:hypothetical protein
VQKHVAVGVRRAAVRAGNAHAAKQNALASLQPVNVRPEPDTEGKAGKRGGGIGIGFYKKHFSSRNTLSRYDARQQLLY